MVLYLCKVFLLTPISAPANQKVKVLCHQRQPMAHGALQTGFDFPNSGRIHPHKNITFCYSYHLGKKTSYNEFQC
jgi:hypothetical protein